MKVRIDWSRNRNADNWPFVLYVETIETHLYVNGPLDTDAGGSVEWSQFVNLVISMDAAMKRQGVKDDA